MTSILAIDPGRNTGWAVVRSTTNMGASFGASELVGSGTLKTKSSPVEAQEYYELIKGLLRDLAPDEVVYEQALQIRQGGYLGLARPRVAIELACDLGMRATPWRAVYPATWRAWCKLKSKDKEASKQLAKQLLGWRGTSDDEAEACLIALWASAVKQ